MFEYYSPARIFANALSQLQFMKPDKKAFPQLYSQTNPDSSSEGEVMENIDTTPITASSEDDTFLYEFTSGNLDQWEREVL